MSGKPKIPVLVTGFEPFGCHHVNISWEIARVLETLHLDQHNVDLIIQELPVDYAVVSKEVPALWEKYKPKLVIHCGVKGSGSEMTIEILAHKNGYTKVDNAGKLPEGGSADGPEDILQTDLDVQYVCDYVNNSTELDVPIYPSINAGRYLCEFTYYNSLKINNSRVIFVHVPDFDKGFSVRQMAFVIKEIILLLLSQVSKHSEEDPWEDFMD